MTKSSEQVFLSRNFSNEVLSYNLKMTPYFNYWLGERIVRATGVLSRIFLYLVGFQTFRPKLVPKEPKQAEAMISFKFI